MKRKISYALLLIFSLLPLLPYTALALNPSIVDAAYCLTDDEVIELSARLDEIRDTYNMDVAVFTEYEMSGYDEESSADDIFDYAGYGMGEGKDGIMLYLSRSPRAYRYTTHGDAERVFNDRGLEYIDNYVLPYLKDGNYYMAVSAYADKAEDLLIYAKNGKPYNEKNAKTKLITVLAVLSVPLIIALIVTSSKAKKMKTAVSQNYADSYMKRGSLKITQSRDIFMYSTVTQTEKPKSGSDGGHTSSSGEHHGGRGGSY